MSAPDTLISPQSHVADAQEILTFHGNTLSGLLAIGYRHIQHIVSGVLSPTHIVHVNRHIWD